ncbi:hypothetical protein ABHN05_15500 [Brevibacillus laterosporus]|uniref:hypothetical protein n=1 Tax=Brevibacillus laterosporus TaxID=1465 RepID=UPI000372BF26|nr:hypothetical protein [Brevibacillus laterosporus]ATO50330.1 hypothetical protein BrL25_15300 [Brevibacillus laterosporus DSM 25]MBG9802950.1 hypothetical protein [Brevibacillus laterosporus]MED4764170.1 hypothetical protein [Brevibacillus laterosporus]TPH15317.1 hypothetical protein EGH09_11770 [Brevibacillus laterosporus]
MALVWADEPTVRNKNSQKSNEHEKREVPSADQSQGTSLRFKPKTLSYLSVRDRQASRHQSNTKFPEKGKSIVGSISAYF